MKDKIMDGILCAAEGFLVGFLVGLLVLIVFAVLTTVPLLMGA